MENIDAAVLWFVIMAETVTIGALFVQGLSSLSIASLTCLSAFLYAWPSYTMEFFKSNATILSSPMSTTEIAFLGSSTNIGGMLATPLCGYAMDKLGRKYTAMLFGLPFVVAWGLISVSTSVHIIIFSIGFAGVGAAGQAVSSVYISEISQDSIRGGLTSALTNGFIVGLLISYILGGHFPYHHVIYIHLAISILYILMVATLKESPIYLMKINKEKEAKESLAFYRQVDKNSKDVERAISKIKLQLDPKLNRIVDNLDENITKELLEKQTSNTFEITKSPWQCFKESESSKLALATVLIVISLSILMGPVVIQVYALVLFQKAIPSMDLNTCCILLCLVYLLGSTICTFIIDKVGRKVLFTTTAVGTGLLSIVLGAQLHLEWAPHWFTAVVIYTYCFVNNLGIAVIPGVLNAEVFLPEVRGFCNSCTMVCMWFSYFITLFVFTPLVEACGIGPTFYIFSIVCFAAASFSHLCLPETKGLSVDAIQLLFTAKK